MTIKSRIWWGLVLLEAPGQGVKKYIYPGWGCTLHLNFDPGRVQF